MTTIDPTTSEISNYSKTQSAQANPNKNESDIENSGRTNKTAGYKPPKDIVEISDEGRQALKNSSVRGIEKNEIRTASRQSTANSAESLKNTGNTSADNSNADSKSEDEEVSTTDLYTMSEYELLQKFNGGNITRKEYDTELARRSNG